MRRIATCLCLSLVALIALAAPTQAQAVELPTGRAQGVKIVWKDGQVIVFGKRAAGLYKKIAGRKVIVSCWHITEHGRDGGDNPMRAPVRGRVLETGDRVRDWDYCRVWRAARVVRRGSTTLRQSRALIVAIPLTQRGAVFLDEQVKAVGLSVLLMFARGDDQPSPRGSFRDSASFVEEMEGVLRVSWFWPGRHPLVALTTPDGTPPAGSIGYYGDGAQHAAAVTLSSSGRRLFLERKADDVLHTNVADYLYGGFE